MHTGTRGRAAKVDRDAATKQTTVEFVRKDADEQIVTGVVMVPEEVDRQGDYETAATIERFAADFGAMYDSGSADGGIMHAAWPSEWMDLLHNGIVGKTFPDDAPIPDDIDTMEGCINWAEAETDVDDPAAFCQSYNVAEDIDREGVWAQTWRVTDDGLWALIDDAVIQGFSIGARDVEWRGPMEQSELPEGVGVPDEYPDDEPVWELTDGVVREVSAVDTPAIPDAQILAKDDAAKALDQYLGDREGFIEEAMQRGHDEADAERLWDVLSRAANEDGAGSPGKESLYERIGKAAAAVVPGVSPPDGHDDAAGAEHQTRPDPDDTAKEGRTLSRANRDSAMAAIDANIGLLEDAGVDHGLKRFTDRDDVDFSLTEHTARTFPTTDPDEDDTTENMSDSNDDPNDEVLAELKALRKDMDELKSDDADGGDPDADADKNDDPDAPDTAELADAVETLTDEVKSLKETAETNADAIDTMSKQSGFSTQVSGDADKNGDGGDESGLDEIKAALS